MCPVPCGAFQKGLTYLLTYFIVCSLVGRQRPALATRPERPTLGDPGRRTRRDPPRRPTLGDPPGATHPRRPTRRDPPGATHSPRSYRPLADVRYIYIHIYIYIYIQRERAREREGERERERNLYIRTRGCRMAYLTPGRVGLGGGGSSRFLCLSVVYLSVVCLSVCS